MGSAVRPSFQLLMFRARCACGVDAWWVATWGIDDGMATAPVDTHICAGHGRLAG